MANAEDDDPFWKHKARENGGDDVPGIDVTGVRDKARGARDFLLRRFCLNEIVNLLGEFARIFRIKLAGNSGSAKHGHSENQLGFEGLPLTLKAFLVSGSKKTVTLSPY